MGWIQAQPQGPHCPEAEGQVACSREEINATTINLLEEKKQDQKRLCVCVCTCVLSFKSQKTNNMTSHIFILFRHNHENDRLLASKGVSKEKTLSTRWLRFGSRMSVTYII
jgi:hypothetical protein